MRDQLITGHLGRFVHVPTPILDQLIHEARTGGIRTGRHRNRHQLCGEELSTNPGEVHTCVAHAGHGGAHTNADRTITW